AQIDEFQIGARFEGFDGGRIDADAEARRIVQQPEKDGFSRGSERARLIGREQRIGRGAVRLEHDRFAADDIDAGALVLEKRSKLSVVAAQGSGALEQTAGISLARQGTESRVFSHFASN